MGSEYTNRYSDEYRRDAIELVRSSGRTVPEVARELGIGSASLRAWVKKDRAARETEPGAGPSEPGGDARDAELKRLRKLTAEQAKPIEILERATVRSMGRCNIPGRTVSGGVAGWRGSGVRGCRTSRSLKCGGDDVTVSR
ncbi:transposase [Streptomyces sp. NPDC097610]|uniref:transposase n=1 Tax=Streptomyces sp. NPDC097610 TaxID=3157227 RepID=UPI00331C484E